MNRNLKVERLYTLGEFKNIKFYDELEGIPEELWKRKEVVDALQMLQMLQIEQAHLKYTKLASNLGKFTSFEDAEKEIENLREQNLSELIKFIKNGNGDTND